MATTSLGTTPRLLLRTMYEPGALLNDMAGFLVCSYFRSLLFQLDYIEHLIARLIPNQDNLEIFAICCIDDVFTKFVA
jgi:hypothetical protein